jgi:hypothetical protein
MTSDRRGSLLNLLPLIQLRPGMYTGAAAGDYSAHLDRLEMLIAGYLQAVVTHDIRDEGVELYLELGPYLESKFGWTMSQSAIRTIRRESASDQAAWEAFWNLLWELRDSRGAR